MQVSIMPRGALMWQENQYYIDVLHEGKIPLTDDDETTYFDKLLTAHEMREKKPRQISSV